jgi:hypothetical protein
MCDAGETGMTEQEISNLLEENKRLTALLEKRYKDVRLVEFRNGQMVLSGSIIEHMAEFMAQMLEGPEGPENNTPANYTETRLTHHRMGELVLTMQRVSGKTPHELRREAEAERDAAIQALAAAQTP